MAANASSTVALVPASLTSALGYRNEIRELNEGAITPWFIVSILGGSIGAALLLMTSDRTFRLIVPWLLLFATLLFAFGAQISIALRGRMHGNKLLMLAILLPVAVYGGYLGEGWALFYWPFPALRIERYSRDERDQGDSGRFTKRDRFRYFYCLASCALGSYAHHDGFGYGRRLSLARYSPGACSPP